MISVVNQEEADRDIPVLIALKSMALIPWIGLSMEPLLGKVTLRPEWLAALDWVIVGGESGTGARPMHPDWVRSPRDQCAAAGVPFHFKQWGEWVEVGHGDKADDCEVRTQRGRDMWTAKAQGPIGFVRIDGKFFAHFDDIQGKARLMHRVGKKAAGRLLDGQQHDGMQT
jgi:protein gp37